MTTSVLRWNSAVLHRKRSVGCARCHSLRLLSGCHFSSSLFTNKLTIVVLTTDYPSLAFKLLLFYPLLKTFSLRILDDPVCFASVWLFVSYKCVGKRDLIWNFVTPFCHWRNSVWMPLTCTTRHSFIPCSVKRIFVFKGPVCNICRDLLYKIQCSCMYAEYVVTWNH